MPQAVSKFPEDPFNGLLLPLKVWKVIDEARITSLEQLKAWAPLIDRFPGIDPGIAEVIRDRLERLAARRTVRVRLVFSKGPHCKPERGRAHGRRRSPAQTGGVL